MAEGDKERRKAAREANRADRKRKRSERRIERQTDKAIKRSQKDAKRDVRRAKKKGTNYPGKTTPDAPDITPAPKATAEDVSEQIAAKAIEKKGETYGYTAAQTKAKEESKPKPKVTKPVRPRRKDFEDDRAFNIARNKYMTAFKAWRAAGSPGAVGPVPSDEGK
tara:strand:+ start:2688 stop:3182 length:495 start_codon:yes stop_codon:yes gene_type:complete